ncbi:MAG: chemotaxis response regulator protein-glutamate methylesterase, partial [Clostridia bacterium]|nr:chemotaxis response regulator protein-glutamate methylesterase [Clostridia bacterium]
MSLPVKVLVVDDSAFMRRVIIDILSADAGIQVVGYARNGKDALEKISRLKPQVVTLDIEMPVMDGLTTLKHLMQTSPVPVLMLSALTTSEAEVTIKALELGAVDFVLKPARLTDMKELTSVLPAKVRAAAAVPVAQLRQHDAETRLPLMSAERLRASVKEIVAIGTSTGGPAALTRVIGALPGDLPAGVVIVQHMPPGFTAPLARRLNELSRLEVREASAGDVVRPGLALLAPAGRQMLLQRRAGRVQVQLTDQAEISTPFKPAADVLFLSVAEIYGPRSLGVILTGMGNDGVRGLKAIKERGGQVLAQDKETSVIFGMPRAAIKAGVVDRVVPLP